ncbi:MAG: YdcF family protein [Kyrpidia sp.]|nr:YdcF family protein [Kyrpidia sp.]
MWGIVAAVAVMVGIPAGLTVHGALCRPRPADAIVILGAKTRGTEPGAALKARLDAGLHLYRLGYAPRIIASGGQRRPGAPSEADVMAAYLVKRGVSPGVVILEDASSDTVENLLFSSRLMKVRGWRRAVVVTSAYHLPRALWLARLAGLDATGYAPPTAHFFRTWAYALREIPAFWRSYRKWRWLQGPG